jgi:hypothetical protein
MAACSRFQTTFKRELMPVAAAHPLRRVVRMGGDAPEVGDPPAASTPVEKYNAEK